VRISYSAYGHTVSIEILPPKDDELADRKPPLPWLVMVNPRGVFADVTERCPTLAAAEEWAQAWCRENPPKPGIEPEIQHANLKIAVREMKAREREEMIRLGFSTLEELHQYQTAKEIEEREALRARGIDPDTYDEYRP
jgi:hypothetical protein